MDAEELQTKFTVTIAAHYIDQRHLMYLRTTNPIHAWSAYQTARRLNVAIPEWVLACFDGWASVLSATTHRSAKAIADDLKIGKKGGRTVTRKAAREMRDLEIVADILYQMDRPAGSELKAIAKAHGLRSDGVTGSDRNVTEILQQVAGNRGLDYSSVKTIWYRMTR
jgi:hypothetical protein